MMKNIYIKGDKMVKTCITAMIASAVVMVTPSARDFNEKAGVNYVDESIQKAGIFKPTLWGYKGLPIPIDCDCEPHAQKRKNQHERCQND